MKYTERKKKKKSEFEILRCEISNLPLDLVFKDNLQLLCCSLEGNNLSLSCCCDAELEINSRYQWMYTFVKFDRPHADKIKHILES